MTQPSSPSPLTRAPSDDGAHPVTRIELFFDLVFVLAVTQLTNTLLGGFTPLGATQVTILTLAVWWLWTSTAWATNLLDPDRAPVRALLIAMMGGCLLLSACLPVAFGARGLVFALTYVALQLGRSLFTLWALRGDDEESITRYQRITLRFALTAPLWVAGAVVGEWGQLGLWAAAILLEFVGPVSGFWVPFRGRLAGSSAVEGGHMAERMGLFVIIALGETVLVTGQTFAGLTQDAAESVAFASTFLSTVTMWFIYFQTGSRWADLTIQRTDEPERLARSAYTYLHIPIVAGIIVAAVSEKLVLSHPLAAPSGELVISALVGPALFLLGTMGFKWATTNRTPWSHLVGCGVLASIATYYWVLNGLQVGVLTTVVLLAVGAWEVIATRRADASGEMVE